MYVTVSGGSLSVGGYETGSKRSRHQFNSNAMYATSLFIIESEYAEMLTDVSASICDRLLPGGQGFL